MVVLNPKSFLQDPLFYGAYLFGLIFFVTMWILEPSPVFAFSAGVIAGRGYASGVHHYYTRYHGRQVPKIRLAQYSCFGVFSSTGMVLNRLYESGELMWYVIAAIMVSSCFNLIRYLDQEYRLHVYETLDNTQQL